MNFPSCNLSLHEALVQSSDWSAYLVGLNDAQICEVEEACSAEVVKEGAFNKELYMIREKARLIQSLRFRRLLNRAVYAESELAKAKALQRIETLTNH